MISLLAQKGKRVASRKYPDKGTGVIDFVGPSLVHVKLDDNDGGEAYFEIDSLIDAPAVEAAPEQEAEPS